MAKVTLKDGSDYLSKLRDLSKATQTKVLGPAIYDAAGIVADEIQKGISGLAVSEENKPGVLNAKQRAGLHNGLGIASLREDGEYLNVKIGWDGYNDIKTVRWPKGQPNQMIARSVERGTSFMQATPFVKNSVKKVKKQSIQAMQDRINQETEKIMKKE